MTNTNVPTVSCLAYCRAGFEPDLVSEFAEKFGAAPRTILAQPSSGFVLAMYPQKDVKRAAATADWRDWIFARQMLRANAEPVALLSNDRVTPIVAAAKAWLAQQKVTELSAVWIEYPDTNDGKTLSKLSQALQLRIGAELVACGLLQREKELATRLHVLLTPQREAYLALADPRIHRIVSSHDLYGGPGTNGLSLATQQFRDANPKTLKAIVEALKDAMQLINADRRNAAQAYVDVTSDKIGAAAAFKILDAPDMIFSATPVGTLQVAKFMFRTGSIKVEPQDWKDMFFPEVHDLPGG